MFHLLKHLLTLWPPFGRWSDTPVGGPYSIDGGQMFCPGRAGPCSTTGGNRRTGDGMTQQAADIYGTVFKNGTATLMARVLGYDGARCTRPILRPSSTRFTSWTSRTLTPGRR